MPKSTPDDPLGSSGRRHYALDLDGEGDSPPTAPLSDRGGQDPSGATFEAAVDLAGGFVGLHVAIATHARVVGIGEAHRSVHEPHRTAPAPLLERGELGLPLAPVGEGLAEALGGVVASGGSVLTSPRSQLVAVLGPEVDQIEVRGAKIVFLRNLSFRLLLGTVLIPVGRDETQQGVIAVARAADVTAQETYLFGSGSIAKR